MSEAELRALLAQQQPRGLFDGLHSQGTKPAPSDARRGELGVLQRPDGGVSTELSITVTEEIAIRRAVERVRAGGTLPSFDSIEDAVRAAEGRPVSEKMQTEDDEIPANGARIIE